MPGEAGDDLDENFEDFDELDQQDDQSEDQQSDEGLDDQQDDQSEDQQIEEQPARQSRSQQRIETLNREARESRERAEAAERRLNDILAGTTRQSAQDQARAEEQRLAQMEPWERAEYRATVAEQRTAQAVQSIRNEIAEANDRAEFTQARTANPALDRVSERVEAELQKLRANGMTAPRMTIAKYLIGEDLLNRAPKARAGAAKKAAANLSRERARPAGGASDVSSNSRAPQDDRAARMKRLEGVTF